MSNQPPADLWQLCDLQTPWCIHTAATLRIANHLQAGLSDVNELAAAAHCDAYALDCLLGYLASKGVFEQTAPGRYALNETARGLLDPGTLIGLDVDGFGGRMAYAWGTLPSYVRTGRPAYHERFGRGFWEDLEANPAIAAQFDALIGPAGHGLPNPNFDITGGWDSIQSVVDLGGGTGAMLAELLRVHPHLQGTLLDQPGTVARSTEIFEQAGVASRVTLCGQSFFDPLPPGAGLYLLRGILNDWPDAETVAILKRAAEAARPNGRVVVLKSVSPNGGSRTLTIEMVLLAGKHRTLDEFKPLVRQAGLEVVSAGPQAAYYVVECRPI
ncbi:methyltransferase [Paludibaculum fermentans]|uniref:Hydroxyneurosporene methyltransferase n=1 Tax=Paludibaculum fermentans TaxID=1473598 RepID=A0A7S7SLT9_PALFE|nr:methyltransferase [Paludibaculum fermentans]QOY88806.1 hydroxyneurosporene methyltransferase [Paludibaculum fermentans]